MKKKLITVFALIIAVVSLSGCDLVNCKESGCSDEVYKDGYCKYHYAQKGVEDVGKGIFDFVTGS